MDIATGTGLAAIPAAQRVGATGRILAVDLSRGMLDQFHRKLESLNLNTIELLCCDAETLNLPPASVDGILCSSAIVFLSDIRTALATWYEWLKVGGWIAFSTFAEDTVPISVLFRQQAQSYGLQVPNPLAPLGTPQKCEQMVSQAGFTHIEVVTESFDDYQPIADHFSFAEGSWQMNLNSPFYQIEGPDEELGQFKTAYVNAMKDLEQIYITPQGFRTCYETFFILAKKPR